MSFVVTVVQFKMRLNYVVRTYVHTHMCQIVRLENVDLRHNLIFVRFQFFFLSLLQDLINSIHLMQQNGRDKF